MPAGSDTSSWSGNDPIPSATQKIGLRTAALPHGAAKSQSPMPARTIPVGSGTSPWSGKIQATDGVKMEVGGNGSFGLN